MLEPQRFTEFSSPELRGASLPEQDLRTLYHVEVRVAVAVALRVEVAVGVAVLVGVGVRVD